ncbi:NAD(P)-dependent oxidoreductase [Paenibacillus xylaniclasticus]|uniref:NAD(P)-dependent oxidoreductase n=1 Tax=Paenibacillus xylaniclasticus TaxID=588083 RepID=UPI000FD72170|nr:MULTISPECIES: NAD(P)-dependent oxidoreductase [Paenibacillus]GFN33531.1 3-hydroxyisobutyrate dehydrogenase [Paenibacillus curdlanolyticus]
MTGQQRTIDSDTIIGFIGTGIMGASMAGHLLQHGCKVLVYNRTRARAEDLLAQGAIWCDSPRQVAERAGLIITMLGYPSDVEQIYFGEDGLLAHAQQGTYLLDMTTSSPTLAKRIAASASSKGLHALDAPVSGGDIGAREARLSIMVGGEPEAFAAVQPMLEWLGTNVVHQGPAGAGQFTKLCNQITIASNMIGVSEALAYAKAAGLDQTTVLRSISSGAAASWSLTNLAPRMIAGDYAPGFYVKHFIKDIRIALESAAEMGLELPGLTLAKTLYERLVEQGGEDDGTQALYRIIASV